MLISRWQGKWMGRLNEVGKDTTPKFTASMESLPGRMLQNLLSFLIDPANFLTLQKDSLPPVTKNSLLVAGEKDAGCTGGTCISHWILCGTPIGRQHTLHSKFSALNPRVTWPGCCDQVRRGKMSRESRSAKKDTSRSKLQNHLVQKKKGQYVRTRGLIKD